jgi:3-oxoacyl-[acyl-carrier protein] reductase
MDLGLKGRNVFITGATRGIGRAIADTFAGEGCNVAICARNQEEIDQALTDLTALGIKAVGKQVDVMAEGALRTWVAEAGEQLGGLDILISNVGAMAQGGDKESWMKNIQVDIFSLVDMLEAGKDLLRASAKQHGDAAVIAVGSVSSTVASNVSSYGPVKSAMVHYIKGFAKQNASKNIRANVVSPGMVYFDGGVWQQTEQANPEFFEAAKARNPTGRMATPHEIANAVVFLASPKSSYTTGINLNVDGAVTDRVNF